MSITPTADFDNTWKQAIEDYFESFLLLCFPQINPLIDWSRGFQTLEKELQEIVHTDESNKRFADKLFQVWLLNGTETWVLIHIEIQSQQDSEFATRMYQYNYRAFDKYQRPVISLAVLGDETNSWRPSVYEYALDGFQLRMQFPIAKIMDYENQWEVLQESSNPFAIMIMAHLKTKATTNKPEDRKLWKWTLVRGLFEKNYTRNDVIELFRFIDRMMALPPELQQQFKQEVKTYQEERKMPLLSRIEEEAMEAGIQRGILQTRREDIKEILEMRFENIPLSLNEALNKINDELLLKALHRQAITVNSLAEFLQLL
jgi:hypothetical protein